MAETAGAGKASLRHSKEAEHFSLKDLELFIEIAELLEDAAKGNITPEELEKRLTLRVAAESGSHASHSSGSS